MGPGGVGFLQGVSVCAGGESHSLALSTSALGASATPTTTLIGAPGITYGANGSVTVTVTAASGASAPTGSAALSIDGGVPVFMPLILVSGVGSSAIFNVPTPGAGNHTLVASYPGGAGFSNSSNTGSLSVAQAPLTVTADNQQRLLGQANPPLTFTPTGLVAGDTIASAFTAPPNCSTTALTSSPAGTYPITCSNAVAPNYMIVSPQSDNVLFAQSRNVLLTPFRLGRWQKDNY